MSYYPNNANGQATNANSTPVTLSTEQQAQLEDIKLSVQLLDNAISGSEMQVDIVAPLPAGTNAIGKLSANSGVDIGDVDVTSLPALPTGTNSIGQVTANAGTNLNTSALALEATQSAGNTLTGAVTETAPASDTASSGLNGRLQRIAQNITTLDAALGSPFQSGGSIGNTAFGVNNASGASAVNIQDGGNSITVDGTVTANAGTNLNTSALALEATQVLVKDSLGYIEADVDAIATDVGLILARTTIDQDYRSDSTTMTTTALQSLASSATVGWQSDRVAITTELDVLIMVSLNPESTAPGGSRAAYVYLIPWYYDGTNWYASSLGTTTLPTGTQGTCTIASPNNLKFLGALMYTATNQDMQDSFLISNVFGDRLPDGWSLEITNDTGSALRSADNVVKYKKINQQTV